MVQYKKLIYENQQVPSQGVLRTTETCIKYLPPKKDQYGFTFLGYSLKTWSKAKHYMTKALAK